MKNIAITFLIICIVASFSQAQNNTNSNQILQEVYGISSSIQNLSGQSVCNTVNIPQYDGVSLSGYLNVGITNSASAIGFIFHGAKGRKASEIVNIPTIIWVDGGAGKGSVGTDLLQLGPLTFQLNADKTFSFTKVDYPWSDSYNLLFVDQPIDVGFSVAANSNDIPTNMDQVAQQFSNALNELFFTSQGCFFKFRLNTAKSPIFIYGQGKLAAKYIASIAEKIVKDGNKFNLLGVGILNSVVSPISVIDAVADYTIDQGLVTQDQQLVVQNKIQEFKTQIQNKQIDQAQQSYDGLFSTLTQAGINIYQIDGIKKESADFATLIKSQQGKDIYKLDRKEFSNNSDKINSYFSLELMKESPISKFEYLLSKNINVQVIAGDRTLIVPYTSQMKWINQLKWTETLNFQKQLNKIVRNKDRVKLGTSQKYKNLFLDIVFGAGYQIAQDQPQSVKYFLDKAVQSALLNKIDTVIDGNKPVSSSTSSLLIQYAVCIIIFIIY